MPPRQVQTVHGCGRIAAAAGGLRRRAGGCRRPAADPARSARPVAKRDCNGRYRTVAPPTRPDGDHAESAVYRSFGSLFVLTPRPIHRSNAPPPHPITEPITAPRTGMIKTGGMVDG